VATVTAFPTVRAHAHQYVAGVLTVLAIGREQIGSYGAHAVSESNPTSRRVRLERSPR
jgi:hypothetical protein